MKALRVHDFGGPEALRLDELDAPPIAAGEVLVRVCAAGVNYPDLLVIDGRYQKLPPRPFVPGKELAGEVIEVGAGVTSVRAGDRVAAQLEHGAFAEAVAVPATHCYPLPEGMPYDSAMALGLVYLTAYLALFDRAGFQAGETVLVTAAAGGVGNAAVQLVRAFRGQALAAVRGEANRVTALAAGAAGVIDLQQADLRDALRREVHAATGGKGADIVIDSLGGDVFDAALRALAWRGRAVVVGFAGGRIPEVKTNYLLVKNISVCGLQVSDYRDRWADAFATAQAAIYSLWQRGELRAKVMQAFPLAAGADALRRLAQGRLDGKIVLTIGGAT